MGQKEGAKALEQKQGKKCVETWGGWEAASR